MIELRALGRIELHGLADGEADALLARPREVALLACLLLAETGIGREVLVARLWPESTSSRGRGSLRVALHGLRSRLGSDAIRSRGDALVVDRAWIGCDALTFEAHVASRRYGEALALYGGELLPGFHLRGVPAFDAWLAARRQHYRRIAAVAAWRLVEEAERRGRLAEAADLARRAAALTPDAEPVLRRLLRVLERAGDRAGAGQAYREWTDRWQRLGAGPSPKTRALAEAILSDRPEEEESGDTRASVRFLAEHRPPPGRIAVLPLLVEGGSARDELLASGLGHELIASLQRISGILVVARGSAERYRAPERRVFRQVGRDLGVDFLLDASVRTLGDRLAIVARLIDMWAAMPVWAEVYEFGPDDVLGVRTRLIVEMLAALRIELSPKEEARLASGPTAEGQAYLAYLEGRALWSHRSRDSVLGAIDRLEAALELDPDFALAWAALADAYLALFPAAGVRRTEARVRAREAARRALALDPDLGEVHATLGLLHAFLDGDWTGAEAELRRACELSPGYPTAHHWLGGILSFVKRRADEGAAELEIARQLDPFSPIIHNDIGLARLHVDDVAGAKASFVTALELDPTFWRSHYDLGVTLFVAGEPEAGIVHLRRAWRQGAYGADPDSDSAREGEGRNWRDTLARKLRELREGRTDEGPRPAEGALVSILLGRRTESLRWLRLALDGGPAALVMQYYPAFAPLHDDAEFVDLLRAAGIEIPDGPHRPS